MEKTELKNEIPGAEYSVDSGLTWQDSPVFEGLTPNTGYRFIARIKATENSYASAYSWESITITTAVSAENVEEIPQTGDHASIVLWASLGLVSVLVLYMSAVKKAGMRSE
ncbi:MAG TPA: sortase B protein-sorting domain-containing protein [Candidatus Atribacteria bacterium]|nr:sortase B protein-sorting domain-containing protein [Candidatus Atribacteria bacterium]